MSDFFTDADSDNPWSQNKGWITIDKANRLLKERATVVAGYIEPEYKSHSFGNGQYGPCKPTHTALLINIQPIEVADTAESLLREIVSGLSVGFVACSGQVTASLERARKLLSKGE